MYANMLPDTKLVAFRYEWGWSHLTYLVKNDVDEEILDWKLEEWLQKGDFIDYNTWDWDDIENLNEDSDYCSAWIDSYIYVLFILKDGATTLEKFSSLKIPVDPDDYDEEEYNELEEDDLYTEYDMNELDVDQIATFLDSYIEGKDIKNYNFWFWYDLNEIDLNNVWSC